MIEKKIKNYTRSHHSPERQDPRRRWLTAKNYTQGKTGG